MAKSMVDVQPCNCQGLHKACTQHLFTLIEAAQSSGFLNFLRHWNTDRVGVVKSFWELLDM